VTAYCAGIKGPSWREQAPASTHSIEVTGGLPLPWRSESDIDDDDAMLPGKRLNRYERKMTLNASSLLQKLKNYRE